MYTAFVDIRIGYLSLSFYLSACSHPPVKESANDNENSRATLQVDMMDGLDSLILIEFSLCSENRDAVYPVRFVQGQAVYNEYTAKKLDNRLLYINRKNYVYVCVRECARANPVSTPTWIVWKKRCCCDVAED